MRARWPAAPGRRAAAALAVAAFVLLGMSDGINGGGVGATDAGVGVSGGDAGADAADCLRDGVLCGEARAAYPEGAPPSPLLLVPSPPGAFETCSSLLILQQAKHPNPPSWNVTSRAVPSLTAGADLSSASPRPPPPHPHRPTPPPQPPSAEPSPTRQPSARSAPSSAPCPLPASAPSRQDLIGTYFFQAVPKALTSFSS
jgi:hypothetical protein